jgi:uncharacterized protein
VADEVSLTPGQVRRRHAEQAVREALLDTRVVLVNGARQSGKSTLLRQIARGDEAEWRDLDVPLVRRAALTDPTGFVDFPDMMVIDESSGFLNCYSRSRCRWTPTRVPAGTC